jgi:hypothetical protein
MEGEKMRRLVVFNQVSLDGYFTADYTATTN